LLFYIKSDSLSLSNSNGNDFIFPTWKDIVGFKWDKVTVEKIESVKCYFVIQVKLSVKPEDPSHQIYFLFLLYLHACRNIRPQKIPSLEV
jgi:hypothetical protein